MDRGGAADDADGATGEERTGGGAKARTDADGGGTRSFVEGWKARVSAHITWPMAIAAADAAERTPRSPSQPRGSDRKIAEKRIKGGDDIGTNAVRFIRRRNRYTPFV